MNEYIVSATQLATQCFIFYIRLFDQNICKYDESNIIFVKPDYNDWLYLFMWVWPNAVTQTYDQLEMTKNGSEPS